jgi:hypothetical protein
LSRCRARQRKKTGNSHQNGHKTGRNSTAPEAAKHLPAHRFFLKRNRGNFKPRAARFERTKPLAKAQPRSPYLG